MAACDAGRLAGTGVSLGNDVQKNVYRGNHTYGSDGAYTLNFEDPNRNAGISNIPQSVSVPFYVQSELVISGATGPNSSPLLLNPPIDDGCINKRFEHNPGAVDLEDDSLSYELVPCRTAGGTTIPATYDPNLVQDSVKINQQGELYWDVPKNVGQFNFAIKIIEWRLVNGQWVNIGYVTRDLQVDIDDCGNNPPIIQPVGPFCVEAGSNLIFDVTATDPDGDPVTLSAFGGPFIVQNPADSFIARTGNPVTSTFSWDTECNHVQRQPFQVTFEARDNPPQQPNRPPPTKLVDYFTTEITVVAPAPKNPSATGGESQIDLQWDESICKQATGYKIYRKEDSYGFIPSECETGVPAYTGYSFLDSTVGLSNTSYIDTNELKRGVRYCYMVVACFPDEVESYASVEFCTAVTLSAPLMTNVDVILTDETNGEIEVKWIYPPEIDTPNFPPPYSFKLYRAQGINGTDFTEIQTLQGPVDTFYSNAGINTADTGYSYKVEMYAGTPAFVLGESDPASSVFLKIRGADQRNILDATHSTPWRNNEYIIFRETNPGSGIFDSIGQSFKQVYVDSGLVNGDEYCYKVQTIGAYTADPNLPSPLINNSQRACGVPIDTTRPCPPILDAAYECVNDSIYFELSNPQDSGCFNDITAYHIFFKKQESDPWPDLPVATITNGNSIILAGEPITGCWAATAVDDAGSDPGGQTNESRFSEILCIQSCPEIIFPNVFTPNGDGSNDAFLPLSVNDIGEINIQIFNRWGTKVFESTSIEDFMTNGWDGTDISSGQPCSDGVYFYVCQFTPQNYLEPTTQEVNGFIHLFRNQ